MSVVASTVVSMSQFTQPPPSGHPVALLCDRLGARLDDLGDPVWWSVPDAELTRAGAAAEVQVRRLEALRTSMVAEAQRRDLAKTVGATGPVPWLAGTVTMTRPRARQVCRLATDLDHGVEATGAAFAAGAVDAERAQAIATAVHALPAEIGPDTRAEAEAFLLEQARVHDAATVAGLGQHLLERVAPDLAEARLGAQLARADARDEHRSNTFTGTTDHRGRIRLRGELDTESWALVTSALEPLAKPAPTVHPDSSTDHDPRTVGQRNADALVELSRRMLDRELLPSRGGYPAHLAVTIDHATLTTGIGAGILDTGTPISAQDRAAGSAATAPCCRCCSAPTGSRSTPAGRSASSPKNSDARSRSATSAAPSPAAHAQHRGPRSTTSCTGPTADPPASTTQSCSAAPTTASSTTANGPSASAPTEDPSSPHPPGSTPTANPDATPSTSDCETGGATAPRWR